MRPDFLRTAYNSAHPRAEELILSHDEKAKAIDKWWTGQRGAEKAGYVMNMLYELAVGDHSVKAAALFLSYCLGLPRQPVDVKSISVSVTADQLRAAVMNMKEIQEAVLEANREVGNSDTDTPLCMEATNGLQPGGEK